MIYSHKTILNKIPDVETDGQILTFFMGRPMSKIRRVKLEVFHYRRKIDTAQVIKGVTHV